MGIDAVIYIEAPPGWQPPAELGPSAVVRPVPREHTYPRSQAYPAGVTHNIRTLDRYFMEHTSDPGQAWKWPQIRRRIEALRASGVLRIWYSADVHDVVDTSCSPEPEGSNAYLLTDERLAEIDAAHARLLTLPPIP